MARRVSRVIGLMVGKVRRFMLVQFRPGYVAQQTALRGGECNRCGRCCEILFQCPFLVKKVGEETRCRIYGQRFDQCVAFPIDERDLADVDFNCTYSFRKMRLLQIDMTGLRVGSDGPMPPFEALPRKRVRLEGLRRVGIAQVVTAVLGVIRERV